MKTISSVSLATLVLCLACSVSPAQTPAPAESVLPGEEELSPARRANRALMRKELAERKEKFAGDADTLVLPGVLADKKTKTVELLAESTGLAGRSIAEFCLIGEGSGHDYESLFTALGTAKDLRAAMEFLGFPMGRGAMSAPLSFWPRGERVVVEVQSPGASGRVRIEDFVLDSRSEESKPMERTGALLCGSFPGRGDETLLAADVDGPCSYISTYNEPTTLLDFPRFAPQGEVYEHFLANPSTVLPAGQPCRIFFTMEPRGDKGPRARDCTLRVLPGAEGSALPACRLTDASGASLLPEGKDGLQDALQFFKDSSKDYDSYVTLDWDEALTAGSAEAVAELLRNLDNEWGIRVEAPKEGQLYYRAFLPLQEWRSRKERPTQPCELRISRDGDGAAKATLVTVKEIWPENTDVGVEPELKVSESPVASVEAFPEALAATGVELRVLLVFVQKTTKLSEALPYIRAVQKTHPNIYLFTE